MTRARLLPVLLLALLGARFSPASAQSVPTRLDGLLLKYVLPEGIRYSDWSAHPEDSAALSSVTEAYAQNDPGTTNRTERIAYFINAHNTAVLRAVVSRYPIRSIRDLAPGFEFFKRKSIMVAGGLTSLDAIVNERLMGEFRDPRLHFALHRACRGGPPLRPRAWRSGTLERDLDLAVVAFLTGPNAPVLDAAGTTLLAPALFEFHARDFETSGGVIAFLNRYRDKKLPAATRIVYRRFDWSLDEVR